MRACAAVSWAAAPEVKAQVIYDAASDYVRSVVAGRESGSAAQAVIRTALSAGDGLLAKILYDLARFSLRMGSIPDLDRQISAAVERPSGGPAQPDTLPTLPGLTLTRLILSDHPGIWMHEARDEAGAVVYQVALATAQLDAIGQGADTVMGALDALRHAGLLRVEEIQQCQGFGTNYVLTVRQKDGGWRSLSDWARAESAATPEECSRVITEVTSLLKEARRVLERRGLPRDLIPVPTCHTLAVNDAGQLRFQDVTLTYADGRRYLGLDCEAVGLQSDHWEVLCLGFLLYELVTRTCAARALSQGRLKAKRLASGTELGAWGAMLRGIIGKATSALPERRYENTGFLARDVQQWAELETAIEANAVPGPMADRARLLWHLQLGLERRFHLMLRAGDTIAEMAPHLAAYVLDELEKGGETREAWVRHWIAAVPRDGNGLHVGSYQTTQLAHALEEQWREIMAVTALERPFTAPAWLRAAAAMAELEAARRSVYILSRSVLRQDCDDFRLRIGLSAANLDTSTASICTDGWSQPIDLLPEALGGILPAVADRLHVWSAQTGDWPPEPDWSRDIETIVVLLIMAAGGATVRYGQVEVPLGSARRCEARAVAPAVASLLSLRALIAAKPRSGRAGAHDTVMQVAETAESCAKQLRSVRLAERRFGLLPSSAFQGLSARGLSQLDLREALGLRGSAGVVSGRSLLPFPQVSAWHSAGCPFSADLVDGGTTVYCIALSLPAVVSKASDGSILPALRRGEPRVPGSTRLGLVPKCCVGLHMFLLFPVPLLLFWQVHVRQVRTIATSALIGAVEANIPMLLGFLLTGYGSIVFARWRRARRQLAAKTARTPIQASH